MSTPALAKAEKTFYTDEQGVRVTSTRLLVESTTFAMSNITSVSRTIQTPERRGPVFIGAFGALFILVGGSQREAAGILVFGAILLGLAIFWWTRQKTTYGLRVASSSGELTPISSTSKDRIDKIVQAVNESIIDRG